MTKSDSIAGASGGDAVLSPETYNGDGIITMLGGGIGFQ